MITKKSNHIHIYIAYIYSSQTHSYKSREKERKKQTYGKMNSDHEKNHKSGQLLFSAICRTRNGK